VNDQQAQAALGEQPHPEAARRRLAEEIRALASATVLTTAGDEALEAALALVQQATGKLRTAMRSSRYEGVPGLAPGSPDNGAIWENHAAFGPSNPLAPPAKPEDHPGRVSASVTFAKAWEGGPGSVYGGFIAAVFDGMLGRAVINAGHLGVTRSLTVRYLRPTPLGAPLRIESVAGELVGRNVTVTGQLWHEETLTCEAEAVFTCVDLDRYRM
jgi:acyl-coenzyme A thioesterase PaaI-like protein